MTSPPTPTPVSLAGLLLDHPAADEAPLLHTAELTWTAGHARAVARDVAANLRDAGVGPGHLVAVQLPNEPVTIATWVGVWLAGAAFVPVNPRATTTERDEVVTTTNPAALVTAEGVTVLDRATTSTLDPTIAFMVWTSGTTGRPLPVPHTHVSYLELIDRVLGPLRAGGSSGRRPTPNLIPVSLALNAGLYNALFGLRAGSEVVLMDRFDPTTFAALVRRFQIRSTVLPPAAIAMLSDAADIDDLAPLAYVRSITAPLSPLHARRFTDRFGAFVLNGYGQVELGEVIGWTAADAKAHPDKLGAAGRPHPGVAIRLDDAGQLLVRPPQTAAGIEHRTDTDGYVATGDLARIDDDGFVWIDGRLGDLINRGGNKVFPDAVEEVLRLSPAVDDAAVVGVPDDRLGEVPVAFLVGRPVPDAELVALCRTHLVPYKVPVAFHWVDALPRSEVGKVLRRELASSGPTSSVPAPPPVQE